MDPGDTNKGIGNDSDEMGIHLGAQLNKMAQTERSDSLVDERSKALEDEIPDEPNLIAKPASPHNNIEALVSPHVTLSVVACHCRCTRIQKSGFMNGNDLDRLRDEVKDLPKTYELASSPNSEDFFSHSTNSSVSRAMYSFESWRTPRTFHSGSPPDVQSLFQVYQSESDGDTASEEDVFGYILSNISTAESAEDEADEDDTSSQDMSDTAGSSDVGN